jgi:hypothetical protein
MKSGEANANSATARLLKKSHASSAEPFALRLDGEIIVLF